MLPDTDRIYGSAPLANARFAAWNEAVRPGVKCRVELYPDKFVEETVHRFTVRRIRPGVYRGAVLIYCREWDAWEFMAVDTSRDDVAHWLRVQGVPVLRIGSALPK